MADTLKDKLKKIDKLVSGINDKAGKVIIARLSESDEIKEKLNIKYIPTPSKNINDTIGGGFPRRRMTIVAGLPDSGKTSLLLETIAYNMKKDPEFIAAWLESEGSLEYNYLTKTFGIDPERFVYMEHEREGAGEAALDKIEAVMATGACDMVVINSLKCLVPKVELEKSITENTIALQARMNAKMVRKFTSLITETNTAFIVVCHLSTDIGSMSRDPLIISGGKAIMFASSLTIDMRKRSLKESDIISPEEGIKIGITVKKNHCIPSEFPYRKTEYYAVFGQGIEQHLETLDNAVKQGVIKRFGAYYREIDEETGEIKKWNDKELSFKGKDGYKTFVIENPDYFEDLQNRVIGRSEDLTEEEVELIKQDELALADDDVREE